MLQATLYNDGSAVGKLTDVDFGGVLFQGDVDCMKFLFIGEDKYAVVGGVYIKGAEELLDFFELDVPVDEARFVNSSNSADPKVKMLMSGMIAGLFFALWL